jgi:hypothetical protein
MAAASPRTTTATAHHFRTILSGSLRIPTSDKGVVIDSYLRGAIAVMRSLMA